MDSNMLQKPGAPAAKSQTNWNMLGSGWDPINLNLLEGTERRPVPSPAGWSQQQASGVVPPGAVAPLGKELFLSEIENFFTDDVASALQVAADDAMNANATQLQLSVVDLSPLDGLGGVPPPAWRAQDQGVGPATQVHLMDQLNRTLLEGLQQTLQTSGGALGNRAKQSSSSVSTATNVTASANKKQGKVPAKSTPQVQGKPPRVKEKPATIPARSTMLLERTVPAKRDFFGRMVSTTSEEADSPRESMSEDSEENKKMTKREKNILACRKARRKRREKMASMEERLRELEAKNSALEKRLRVTSLPTDNLPADFVEKQDFDSVKEDRIAVITGIYRAMNDGKLETEQHNFHPNCVMVKPMEELIGAQSMWRSWSALRQRFASMHWEILKIDPLDLRGDQIRTEWVFHGLLKGDVSTIDELARVKREDLKRVFEMEENSAPSSSLFVVPPKSPKSGSKLTAIEFQGRSYYIFTADNRLVFVNHNFVRAPTFRRMGAPEDSAALEAGPVSGISTSLVAR